MKNKKIYKYFLISLLATVGGLIYFVIMQKSHIVIKEESGHQIFNSDLPKDSKKKTDLSKKEKSKRKRSKDKYIDNTKLSQVSKDQENQKIKQNLVQPKLKKSEKSDETNTTKVNINTANQDELVTLNGIGEKKATLIIKYRKKNGKFTKIEDIMKIKGIKEKSFHNIKDNITISE